jgi:hypothetical protein
MTRLMPEEAVTWPLPAEFLIFEELQKMRAIGYEPIWKDYRYILVNPASGEEIDPFLWKGNWPKWLESRRAGDDVTRRCTPGYGNYDVLFDDILEGSYGNPYDRNLYTLKLLGADRITMKDNRFIIAEKSNGNDAQIDFDRVRVRDAAIQYGWEAEGEAILHDYGFIMQRKGHQIYLPMDIDTGERFEIPAKEIVISRALGELNKWVKHGIERYGSREMIPEPIEPGPEVTAKRFLDLCDVRIAWDETSQQYKIAE